MTVVAMTAAMTAAVTTAVTTTPVAASECRFAHHGAKRQNRDQSNGGFHGTKRPGTHGSLGITEEETVVKNREAEAAQWPQAQLELTT
jgi:hypothetical protein